MTELKRQLDKWYLDYCREHKKAPTWGELVAKKNELQEVINHD